MEKFFISRAVLLFSGSIYAISQCTSGLTDLYSPFDHSRSSTPDSYSEDHSDLPQLPSNTNIHISPTRENNHVTNGNVNKRTIDF